MNRHARAMIADARPQCKLRAPARSGKRLHGLRAQAGSMLLEAFIAILIFSMGILAIVGMQASAVKTSADAKYRSEASMLANALIGQMWVSNRASLQANFQSGGGTANAYTTWYAGFNDANPGPNSLPGSSIFPPTVAVNPATGLVTVQVFWLAPNESNSATPHNYTVIAQIN